MNQLNIELFEKLSRLQWLMRKQQNRTHAERNPMADPTRGQGRILALLKLQDGISTKDLSYLLGIRVSSLNELLAKMEKNDYITREPSAADKRVMLVKLTEKGKSEQQEDWTPGALFTCLSEDEQNTFSNYLDRIIASIEAQLGEEADEDERDWWSHGGRKRMGDEKFERLAAMGRGGFAHGEEFDPRHFCGRGGFPHGGRHGGRNGDGHEAHGGRHGKGHCGKGDGHQARGDNPCQPEPHDD